MERPPKRAKSVPTYEEWLLSKHGIPSSLPDSSASSSESPCSEEFQRIIELVLTGTLSAPSAQRIAEGGLLDVQRGIVRSQHPEMTMLASAGSHGDHPHNVWRDLQGLLRLKENRCRLLV